MAQDAVVLEGRLLMGSDTTEGLGYAHVHNTRTRATVVSRPEGSFRIGVAEEDSLEIRMIGYADTLIAVSDIRLANNRIILAEKTYQLRQVDVTADKLTQPFAPEQRSDKPYMGYGSVRASGRSKDAEYRYGGLRKDSSSGNPGVSMGSGLGKLASKFNKDYQQRSRLAEVKEAAQARTEYQALYEKWFSLKRLKELTELEGSLLERFKNSLSPDQDFLLSASEYEIISYILEQLKAFRAEG